ncbi:ATP-binding cassette domain-containing protein, partial [Aliarcobacter butzleri]
PLISLGFSQKQIDEKVINTLKLANILHKKDELVSNLSGGEKQRCAIARALVNDCEIILCDEPTANLDYENSKNFIEILKELKELKKTIIIATHDPIFDNLDFVDSEILIKNGQICE